MGSYLKEKLKEMNHSFIREVRGKGLWIGVELDSNISAKKICLSLMKEGILAKETHETIIRFAPPLLIKKEEIDWAIKKINKVFQEYQ
jgi:ornithine--oxo-acid transaminase